MDRVEKDKSSERNVTEDVDVNKVPTVSAIVSKDPYDYSSDSSGQGTRFAKRTGNFDLDFPESPKTSKMKGNQLKKISKNVPKISEDSIGNKNKTTGSESESDTVIQPSGVPMKQQDMLFLIVVMYYQRQQIQAWTISHLKEAVMEDKEVS